ncbi:hypothetical protein WY02_03625 [Pseudonocardia sp. AL041005-10]|nr:hypothetical protein [Pseudonocardia sp. AL041005-10]ALE77687.1 hypothetical protein WY02_03625 [Pseudonocardia sp. AL041005-10]
MADLTPEVLNALVRVMNGELDVAGLTEEQLYALAEATRPDVARSTLYAVLVELNNRRIPFAEIGARLGVHEATASRWARPPAEDRRRRGRPDAGV